MTSDHPWAVNTFLGWTCLGPIESRFPGDAVHYKVYSMIINDWQSYPLDLHLVYKDFLTFEGNCVIVNSEFDECAENLVQKSFY